MFKIKRSERNLKPELILFLGLIFLVSVILSGAVSAATTNGTINSTVKNTAPVKSEGSSVGGYPSVVKNTALVKSEGPSVWASPSGGTYSNSVTVSLNKGTPSIYTGIKYRTHGTIMWRIDQPYQTYTGPITITGDTMIEYYGTGPLGDSSVYSDTYYITTVSASPKGGTTPDSQTVTLSGTHCNSIQYTTYDPSYTGIKIYGTYSGPITITKDTAIDFYGVSPSGSTTKTYTETYYITTVSASPKTGTYADSVNVALSGTHSNSIRYTTYDPSYTGPRLWYTYSGPITITKDTAIDFYGVSPSGSTTKTYTERYYITKTTTPTVSANPSGGTYNQPISVTLSGTNYSEIRYFTYDPSTIPPSNHVWYTYTTPININTNTAIDFYATGSGGTTSTYNQKYYIVTTPTDTTPPKIVKTYPVHGSTISNTITKVGIKFSEIVIPKSMWIVISGGGKIIAFTPSISGSVLALNLKSKLKKGIRYTVALHTGCVTDRAGNQFKSKNISFIIAK